MMQQARISRRGWLAQTAALAAGTMLTRGTAAGESTKPKLCIFSKHLQFLDYTALAKAVKAAGADGVDLTVRDKGHVLPENVARDLPLAVEALKAEGLSVEMVSTYIKSGSEPHAEETLAAMSQQGIKFLRVGGHKYAELGDPVAQIAAIENDCRNLATLCEKYGVYAGYHNHSGRLNFGAPMWDLLRVIEAVRSPHFGSNFDIGHCTAEGPFGDWDITSRAFAPHAKMCAVKDFRYRKAEPEWVELGKGIVPIGGFLQRLKDGGFTGPIGIHFEYDAYGDADEAGKLQQISAAVQLMRAEIAKVWG